MAVLSSLLNLLGGLLLTHAVYSAYEHSTLHSTPQAATPSRSFIATQSSTANPSATPFPTDITLELLTSVLLLCVGIVSGSPALKPIAWRTWAHDTEMNEGKRRKGESTEKMGLGREEVGTGVDPFRVFEERSGFLDIRKERAKFAEWVRNGKDSKQIG